LKKWDLYKYDVYIKSRKFFPESVMCEKNDMKKLYDGTGDEKLCKMFKCKNLPVLYLNIYIVNQSR